MVLSSMVSLTPNNTQTTSQYYIKGDIEVPMAIVKRERPITCLDIPRIVIDTILCLRVDRDGKLCSYKKYEPSTCLHNHGGV